MMPESLSTDRTSVQALELLGTTRCRRRELMCPYS